MAFLHQTKFRPACVVAALPKRFRDSLSRELKGAVAVFTCPVSELESTVRRQGATIAVVGVSPGTIEVAERLSHTDRKVKVFLAHYAEGSSVHRNGFAGVFDLRAEAKRLAAAIKGIVGDSKSPTLQTSPFARPAPSLLARFIHLQKKVGNSAALSDGILEQLLDLVSGTDGFLLQPERMDETTFWVTANRGENMPPIGQSIPFDSSLISSADTFAAEDWGDREVAWTGRDHFAVPIQSHGLVCAIFVCDKIDRTEFFEQFLEAISYLFKQVAEREAKSLHDELVATARLSIAAPAGWLLVNGDGRVIHREGSAISSFKLSRNCIKEPRLQDLVRRSFLGEAPPIDIKGLQISARTIISDQGLFCLLDIHEITGGMDEEPLRANDFFQALTLIRSSFAKRGDEKLLANELLSLVNGKGTDSTKIFTDLQKLGVQISFDEEDVPSELASRIGFILFIATKEVGVPISATFKVTYGLWVLTAEVSEKDMGTAAFDWDKASLLRAALEVSGFDRTAFRTAVFGFQLLIIARDRKHIARHVNASAPTTPPKINRFTRSPKRSCPEMDFVEDAFMDGP